MNNIKPSFILLILILMITLSSGCASFPVSDHCDGSVFFNKTPDHTFSDMIKWMWEMDTVEWPESIIDPVQPKPPIRLDDGRIRVTFVNHATTLIQYGNVNILTDPIWSERAGPLSWMGSKRIRKPGVAFEDLPKIDIILISHNHYDHLDLPTLESLIKRDNPVILTGLGTGSVISPDDTAQLHELDWWQHWNPAGTNVSITCVPAVHNSGRGLFDGNKSLWCGFVITGKQGSVYFAGDTAFGDFFGDIRQQCGPMALAILPIGNYEKRWIMKIMHMNPEDAVNASVILGARKSMGIHFATFLEHPEQAVDAHEKDLAAALMKMNIDPSQFIIPAFGEGIDIH
jgi:L-ascorbate metabolism protein UlaG (beta-lactamase superfamily)